MTIVRYHIWFQPKECQNPNENVRISDVFLSEIRTKSLTHLVLTKLDHFIYNFFKQCSIVRTKKLRLKGAKSELWSTRTIDRSDFSILPFSDIRISAFHCTHKCDCASKGCMKVHFFDTMFGSGNFLDVFRSIITITRYYSECSKYKLVRILDDRLLAQFQRVRFSASVRQLGPKLFGNSPNRR